ncbi:hypothetical protein GPECTOR_23g110 [Gonium pectorale]|uniref:NAD-dependent epimerase/dehydratase domain-containing protein n=1 Tax=Gonium pectorale TaxID=33097 RepID=A0A150GGQ7_GONPE|nr:hypothetical protein GPECTOR_23g110 [Gonium pectorale]|eukprot:KXZ49022.1 hypothetical protein GPECTOR_23g110 [Gonium pectorale]
MALSAQKALLRPLAAEGRIAWFGYLSSTGVYGDWQGEWVDESSPCRQTSSKAIVRQEAESAWMQLHTQHGLPTHVFRLGGIYGPGRSVLDSLTAQSAELSSSKQRRGRQRYTARCHVYDIAAVLAASMAAPRPGSVYNVADDEPAPRGKVAAFARILVGQPAQAAPSGGDGSGWATAETTEAVQEAASEAPDAPAAAGLTGGERTQQSRDGSGDGDGDGDSRRAGDSSARSRSRSPQALEEKRVRNALIKSELGVRLRYPTYREGVAAIHGGDLWPLTGEDLRLLR